MLALLLECDNVTTNVNVFVVTKSMFHIEIRWNMCLAYLIEYLKYSMQIVRNWKKNH